MTAPDEPFPDVTASRRAYEGWVNVRIDSLRYASGRESEMTVVEHPGGVTLLAIDGEDRLLFVRQHRHATGCWLLELPAGTLDAGEAPQACAERELQEETGYRPGRIERLARRLNWLRQNEANASDATVQGVFSEGALA